MNILDEIIKKKIEEISLSKEILPMQDLKKLIESIDYGHREFMSSLRRDGEIKIIAEVKKFAPSSGNLSIDGFDPIKIAREYENAGVSAISVLTDFKFFGGKKQHLAQIRSNVNIPVLRKDFIIDEYQIYETRYLSADALLLIVRIIDDVQLEDYISLANELGLEVLVEVYDEHDIARALKLSPYPKLIGINNRDLETFKVDINRSIKLCKFLPDDVVKVSESGIESREDVSKVADAGFDAILIGSSLMKAKDKIRKIFELLGKN